MDLDPTRKSRTRFVPDPIDDSLGTFFDKMFDGTFFDKKKTETMESFHSEVTNFVTNFVTYFVTHFANSLRLFFL